VTTVEKDHSQGNAKHGWTNRKVSLCYVLLGAGLLISFFSLAPFSSRELEIYAVEYSKICYDNYQLTVPPNSTQDKIVSGHGFNSTMFGDSVLNITLEAHADHVNLGVERINVTIKSKYTMKGASFGFPYIYWLESNSDWMTIENYDDISFLSTNHTIANGTWQYRLRFENRDPQTNRTVTLSVVEYWPGVDFKDVNNAYSLLPSNFLYPGAILLCASAVALFWGVATKKLTQVDLREPIDKASHKVRRHVGTKEVVFTVMLTLAFLFVSFFASPGRLGVGEVLMNGELGKTFVRYSGFPLEMIGTVVPLVSEDWELLFAAARFYAAGHAGSGRDVVFVRYDMMSAFSGGSPSSAPFLVLWDGFIPNLVLYVTFSFFLVFAARVLTTKVELARYYAKEKIR
jgi:hypothetical protein